MNSQARLDFPGLTEANWESIGFNDPPSSEDYHLGLSNPIHPLFRRTNPYRRNPGKTIWLQYQDESDYQRLLRAIEPVLKLASAMIKSTASLNTLYHIGHSPRVYPADGVEYQGQPVMEIRPRIQPGEEEREIVRAELVRLAESIFFVFEHPAENTTLEENHGNTAPTFVFRESGINIIHSLTRDNTQVSGMASVIRISDRFLKQLAVLWDRSGDNTSQILTLEAKMAMTICHEVAHAYGYAVDQPLLIGAKIEQALRDQAVADGVVRTNQPFPTNEPFMEDANEAELGWLWESAMFGGKVESNYRNQDHPSFVVTWPGFLSTGPYPHRRGNSGFIERWMVPLHFIRAIHSQRFWSSIQDGDATALHIDKILVQTINYVGSDLDPHWGSPGSSQGTSAKGKEREEGSGPESDPYLANMPRTGPSGHGRGRA